MHKAQPTRSKHRADIEQMSSKHRASLSSQLRHVNGVLS